MAKSVQKITLSSSRDIPFDKLLLSQSNVRHVKAGVSLEELAEDIARRGLLQGLSVRAVADEAGVETGMFEIPAGGRRYRALALLVKQRRLAKTAPVPCVVRESGLAEEDSLAENIQRAPLHPLDQFRAFLALRAKGQSEEEIAANQFVSVAVVKQRLRLASVSPKLLDVYSEDGMTLDQLMAFTVNGDHERQEQVLERLRQSYDKQPYVIRRMLTEGAVRASDKRAQFVGLAAYEEAGGTILNDLFQGDDGGWLQDVSLVDMMVAEKLNEAAVTIGAEGWRWVEVAPDLAYGHTYGLRQLRGETVPLTAEEEATCAALQQEVDDIEAASAEAEELTDEQDERMGELETAIAALNARPVVFDSDEVALAGAFVSIAADGSLRIDRGYVRPEDELPVEPETEIGADEDPACAAAEGEGDEAAVYAASAPAAEPEEDEGLRPIPDRLLTELTVHRTLALRHALGERPDIAFLAALHALALGVFYTYRSDTCLELDLKSFQFGSQAPGLNDTPAGPFTGRTAAVVAVGAAEGVERALGRVGDVRRRQPRRAVRALRLAVGERGARSLEPSSEGVRARRPDRPGGRSRHGGELDADGGQLPRPGHQGAHPAGRGGSARPACGRAHRAPEKGRDGDGGRDAARRLGLAARTAAHAGSGGGRHGRERRDGVSDRGRTRHRGHGNGGRRTCRGRRRRLDRR